ncbi:MAG: sulfatase-like hydrolase/transferase, partial [Armatimonadetes bacterium]|nr:sulfatase-like hydrolase/transferase [Armatimonadota bacterium]
LKYLDATGKKDTTLIIFTSDNGATNVGGADRDFFESNGGLRAGKMSLYEGGIRVPMIARWPGKIPANSTRSDVVTCFDAMATLCEAAGVTAPKRDSLSYLPALTGNKQPGRPFVYFEYPEASAMQAVIFGRYKAIRPNLKEDVGLIELYDLDADPGESTDLSKIRPELVREALRIMGREHVPNPDFPLGKLDKS